MFELTIFDDNSRIIFVRSCASLYDPILFNGARESDSLSHHYMVL